MSDTNPLILGPDGQPLRLSPADRTKPGMDAFDSYQAASFKFAPYNADAFIASKGYKVLDDMMSIGPVRASMGVIRDAVLYKGWEVIPAVNDQANADYKKAAEMANALEYVLNNIRDQYDNSYDLRYSIWEMLYAVHSGFHVADIMWRYMENGPFAGKLGLEMLAHKPCKQIGFDVHPQTLAVRTITCYTPQNGYDFFIPVEKALRYTFAPHAGLPYGQGVGRAAYKHSWTLDFLYRFWNIALEVYGTPFLLAKAEASQLKLVQTIISQIRQGAPAALPKETDAELIETTGNGLNGFKVAAEHHAQQIGYIYLYNTLSTGEGQRTGSMALGKVHENTGEYNLSGRRRDIEGVLNTQLVRRWVIYNYTEEALPLAPRISLGKWDETDTVQLSTAFKNLIDAKVLHPGETQIRQRLGLAPLEPELKEKMDAIWDASTAPSTIPGNSGGNGDPQ